MINHLNVVIDSFDLSCVWAVLLQEFRTRPGATERFDATDTETMYKTEFGLCSFRSRMILTSVSNLGQYQIGLTLSTSGPWSVYWHEVLVCFGTKASVFYDQCQYIPTDTGTKHADKTAPAQRSRCSAGCNLSFLCVWSKQQYTQYINV